MTEGLPGLIAAGTGPARMRRELDERAAPALSLMTHANEILSVASRLPPGLAQTALMELYSTSLRAALAVTPSPPPSRPGARGRQPASETPPPEVRSPESALGQLVRRVSDLAEVTAMTGARVVAGNLSGSRASEAPRAIASGVGELLRPMAEVTAAVAAAGLAPRRSDPQGPAARSRQPTPGMGLLTSRLAGVLAGGQPAIGSAPATAVARGQEMLASQAVECAAPAQAAAPAAAPPPAYPAAGPLGVRRRQIAAWPGAASPTLRGFEDDDRPRATEDIAPPGRRRAGAIAPTADLSERIADILREQATRQGIDLT